MNGGGLNSNKEMRRIPVEQVMPIAFYSSLPLLASPSLLSVSVLFDWLRGKRSWGIYKDVLPLIEFLIIIQS